MIIKIKKLDPNAVIPTYASEGKAGKDLIATSVTPDPNGFYVEYSTGLSMEIPEGHAGFIFPVDSASNTSQIQADCVGIVDSVFRGEIKVRFKDFGGPQNLYKVGDKIAQPIVLSVPQVIFEESVD